MSPVELEELAPTQVTLEKIRVSTKADYAIWWRHENSRLLHGLAANAPNHLNAMKRSKTFIFDEGDGVVGRVFSNREPFFVEDVATTKNTSFKRFKIASGTRGAAGPSPPGVASGDDTFPASRAGEDRGMRCSQGDPVCSPTRRLWHQEHWIRAVPRRCLGVWHEER